MPPLVSEHQAWVLAALKCLSEDSILSVSFNDIEMKLPVGTILTMVHCTHLIDNKLKIYVENQHGNWMLNAAKSADYFIDVGAATGASLLPIAITNKKVKIIAFEPTVRASKLLKLALTENNLVIDLSNCVVSDAKGMVSFREINYNSEEIPYLVETSSIVEASDYNDSSSKYRSVCAVTLDSLQIAGKSIVLKVDVEGAEVAVLRGAEEFLKRNIVDLSIDIHGDTEEGCRKALGGDLNYDFKRMDHVLICKRLNHGSIC